MRRKPHAAFPKCITRDVCHIDARTQRIIATAGTGGRAQTVLILGAGPGIGQAVAAKYGQEGWRVVLAARSAERLATMATELRATGVDVGGTLSCDVSEYSQIQKAVADADTPEAPLGTVVFNAAHVRGDQIFDIADDDVSYDLNVNIGGGLHTMRT